MADGWLFMNLIPFELLKALNSPGEPQHLETLMPHQFRPERLGQKRE